MDTFECIQILDGNEGGKFVQLSMNQISNNRFAVCAFDNIKFFDLDKFDVKRANNFK